MIKLKRSDLNELFKKISEKFPLYLPVKKAGEVNYGAYEEGAEVSLDTLKTVRSAKDFFFPQSETMMKFRLEGKNIEIDDIRGEVAPFVLFGVRACDYRSFSVLDKVFLSDPVDTYYKARRDAGIIVTLSCSAPEESCFCTVFGIDPAEPQGDVTCHIVGENVYFAFNTEKAAELENVIKSIGENADGKDEEELKAAQNKTRDIMKKLPFTNLDLSRFKHENLNELFDSPEWKDLSEACLGCGTCTFVCPTCQCFDIRDFKTNKGVMRFRCWDSCMYKDFTQMAAANSRTTQLQRYRQRFMHKLIYYPSQYDGTYSCVGCGRCVNKCPQKLNIVKVIKRLGEEKK